MTALQRAALKVILAAKKYQAADVLDDWRELSATMDAIIKLRDVLVKDCSKKAIPKLFDFE